MAEMEETSARQPNFSQEETDVLVREVQSRSGRIYGHANRPPRADDAKAAWEEVTAAAPHKRGGGGGGGGGGRTTAAAAVGGQGGGEGGRGRRRRPRGGGRGGPGGAGAGARDAGGGRTQTRAGNTGRRRNRVQREDRPFLETQRAGFQMLERELGSMGARLGSLEAQVKLLQEVLQASLLPLASGVATLQRLVQGAERLLPPAHSSAPACPRWPLRLRTRGGRPPALMDRPQRPDPRGGGGGGGGRRRRRRGVGRGEQQ
ncbi:myb-related transcription factor%2C partner of profilin-like [Xyrichtys novacula]|uniref:Myb-related transcription factor, partner of profilin-like n=1 Tax=Xyrichtys novacula TaxID=13765 RepID=A0AAV1H777_XYRNO|nr:myb-related transcription factor%2C partner of profilin-like [Xyrichtys novacula]